MKRFTTLLASVLTVSTGLLSAQLPYNSTEGITYPQQAQSMFNRNNYIGCLEQLKKYYNEQSVQNNSADLAFLEVASAMELNKPDAEELMNAYLKKYPQTSYKGRSLYLLGSYKINQGQYSEAIPLLEQAGDSWLSKAEKESCYYKLAFCFLQTGEIQAAKGLFQQLSQNSDVYEMGADYYLAYINYLQKDYDAALKGFMPLMNIPQYNEVVPFYVAQIYFINGKYEKAIEAAQRLSGNAAIDKESKAEMLRLIGESYYYMGNGSNAIKYLTEYVGLTNRPTRSAYYALGLADYEAGQFKQAIAALSKCTSQNDIYAQTAYYYLALSYLKTGDQNNARMAFEAASKMNFDQKIKEMAMYNYALTVYETAFSPFNESVKAFEAFLNAYPNSVYAEQASSYLVDVYMTTKNYTGALASIQQIAKPTAKILAAKQRILFYLGTEQVVSADFKKAITLFTEAIDLGNYNPEIKAEAFYWRGESYYRLENYSQAVSNFQRFLSDTKDRYSTIYALAQYNLGYAYFKMYDFAKARVAFERFVDLYKDRQSSVYADALNRLGDCQYYRREFNAAEKSYTAASQVKGFEDYALFQKATMQGIQRQPAQKIQTLSSLLNTYPKSEYVDDALLERGRAQISVDNYAGAIQDFQKLIKEFNTSSLAPVAAIQLSLAYRNIGDKEHALESYKYILKNFPGSDEAKVANADLKAMYQDLNRIDEYASYVNNLGGAFSFSVTEQDSLTYLAAEQAYLKGDNIQGEKSFVKYLQSFPEGAFVVDANYNLGVITMKTSSDVAERYFEKVVSFPNNKYTEDALAVLGDIYMGKNDHSKAYSTYKDLSLVASKKALQLKAKEGMMKSAAQMGQNEDVVLIANTILSESGLKPDLHNETLYMRAKALTALNQKDHARKDYEVLSKDTRSVYGAEAKYILAEENFNEGNMDKSEAILFDFIDQGTPHQYWLAKGFILLSDIYVNKKDDFQAKQYLLSLKNNYKANDELQKEISDRLQKIQAREQKQTRN